MNLSDLWRWDGTVDRRTYLFWGLGLAAFKYNLDRLIAGVGFGREWLFFHYYEVPLDGPLTALSGPDAVMYGTMALVAIPFVWTGMVLTIRRLRSARLPLWLAALFFVPLVNLLFFLVLSAVPAAATEPATPKRGFLDRFIPESKTGSAALAIAVTGLLGVALTLFSVQGLQQYGWGLFVGVPFTLSLVAVLIYGYHRPRDLGSCMAVGMGTVAMLAGLLIALMVEGIVCLAMAAPIGALLGLLGAILGWALQSRLGQRHHLTGLALLLFLPVLMGAEARTAAQAPLIAVTTAVTIQAPPEVVWKHVVSFSELPEPTHWIFKTGIAYPQRATITGTGVGAVRRCEFSTGPFIEPITRWEEPRLLAFSVQSQPKPMKEISLHPNLEAPHLDAFLVCERGQFALTRTADGGTRLEGTTWYRHRIWPVAYWRLYSDEILHRIHGRVLHIRTLSEDSRHHD